MTELSHPVALDRIGPRGIAVPIVASPAECAAVASRLGLPSVRALKCSYEIRRIGPSVIEAAGVLDAAVEQVCVVTLEPFGQTVHESFTVHFVPAGSEDEEPDPDAIDQIPFEGSAIDLGEAAVEQLALTLDPYPRRPGAVLPEEAAAPDAGPFGALLALRRPV